MSSSDKRSSAPVMPVLSASWEALTQRITENPTLAILKHVTECMAVLSNDAESNESTSPTDVIRSVAVSSFSLSVEKILLELMASQCQLTASETNQFTELGATIMKLYPASAKLERTGNSQKTLMHRIASRSSTLPETIRLVHAADPRCIESQDAMGALPLHHATHAVPPSIAVIRTLLQLYPDGARIADKAGYLPLHWAVNSANAKVEIVRLLLKAYPDGAKKACNGGSLPLHWCVDRDKPLLPIVEELTNAFPGALQTPCSSGWLPLHRCLDRAEPKLSVLKWLINHYSKGLSIANCDGQLPLHRLVDRSAPSLTAIHIVSSAYPEALLVADIEGYLPLHLALDGDRPSVKVVCMLLEMCPQSAAVSTIDGLLPLHCAINCLQIDETMPKEIILSLLAAYPDAALKEAVDMVPADSRANPDTWSGTWKQVAWSPLSKAQDMGDTSLIRDIQSAVAGVAAITRPSSQSSPLPPPTRLRASSIENESSFQDYISSSRLPSRDASRPSAAVAVTGLKSGGGGGGLLSLSSAGSAARGQPPPTISAMASSKSVPSLYFGSSSDPASQSPSATPRSNHFIVGDGSSSAAAAAADHRALEAPSFLNPRKRLDAGDVSTRISPRAQGNYININKLPPLPTPSRGNYMSGATSVSTPGSAQTPKDLAIDILSPTDSNDDNSSFGVLSRTSMDSSTQYSGSGRGRGTGRMWGLNDELESPQDPGGGNSSRLNHGLGSAFKPKSFPRKMSRQMPGQADGSADRDGDFESAYGFGGQDTLQHMSSHGGVRQDRRQRRHRMEDARALSSMISKMRPVTEPAASSLLDLV